MKEKTAHGDGCSGAGKTPVAIGDNPLTILPEFSRVGCEISLEGRVHN
ncbi:MAG: hypothetical protein R3B95_19540 [Nitrospirales bacterium]|nr:hypothetical protein [Nitrospirales bacterium]